MRRYGPPDERSEGTVARGKRHAPPGSGDEPPPEGADGVADRIAPSPAEIPATHSTQLSLSQVGFSPLFSPV